MFDFYEIVGLGGVTIVLLAYFLLNSCRLTQFHISFQLLNLMGASMILFSLIAHWNVATFCIEIAWITISVVGLFKIWLKRYREQRNKASDSD